MDPRHGDAQRADDVRPPRPGEPAGRARTARRTSTRRPASPNPREDFDCAEVYVPFSWYEPMWLENLGFCAEGDGWKLTEAGATAPDGDIPWNPSGGVLSSNPIGASGMVRFGEAAQQVREPGRRLPGRAEDREGARPRVRRRLAVLLDVGRRQRQALADLRKRALTCENAPTTLPIELREYPLFRDNSRPGYGLAPIRCGSRSLHAAHVATRERPHPTTNRRALVSQFPSRAAIFIIIERATPRPIPRNHRGHVPSRGRNTRSDGRCPLRSPLPRGHRRVRLKPRADVPIYRFGKPNRLPSLHPGLSQLSMPPLRVGEASSRSGTAPVPSERWWH